MKSLEQHKGLIIAVVFFVILFYIYNTFLSGLIGGSKSQTTADVGADLVKIYNQLQAVSFQTDLFRKPAYKDLKDFSTPLQSLPVGRSNPWNPIGRD